MLVYCWWIQLAVAEKEEISKSLSGKLSPVGFYIPPFCSIRIFLTCTINTPFMFPTLTVLFFWKLILRNQIVRNRKGVLKLKSQPFPLHSGLFLQTCMLCTRYVRGVLWKKAQKSPSPETLLSLRGLSGLSRCSPEQQERVDKSLLQNVSNVFWLIIWIHPKWLLTIQIFDSPAIHVTCLKRVPWVLRCVSLLPLDRYKGPGNLLDNTILAPLALIHSSSKHSASKYNWWI